MLPGPTAKCSPDAQVRFDACASAISVHIVPQESQSATPTKKMRLAAIGGRTAEVIAHLEKGANVNERLSRVSPISCCVLAGRTPNDSTVGGGAGKSCLAAHVQAVRTQQQHGGAFGGFSAPGMRVQQQQNPTVQCGPVRATGPRAPSVSPHRMATRL